MAESTLVIGRIITCMEMENILGRMVEVTMATILMTRSMAMEFTFGLMVDGMKATGRMVSNTVKEGIACLMVVSKLALGMTA